MQLASLQHHLAGEQQHERRDGGDEDDGHHHLVHRALEVRLVALLLALDVHEDARRVQKRHEGCPRTA